jgi:hypothetical protein
MVNRIGAASVIIGALSASPALATAFMLSMTGTVQASSPAGSPNPVVGLGFGTGDAFTGRWRIDLDAGTAFDVALVGLNGLQRVYAFSVSQGDMRIAGAGGATRFTQTAASRGAVMVLNNYALPGPARLDQVSLIDGARFDGGLVETYGITGPAPAGTFLRSISFGKNLVGNVTALPGLVTSLDRPDFAAILAGGAPNVAVFSVARGTPLSAAGINDLPISNFSIIGVAFSVNAVPEPGSWAMLIAGFGLVGAAMRRRAATPATAAAV